MPTNYAIRAALWQIPTMVIKSHRDPDDDDRVEHEASLLSKNVMNNLEAQDRLRVLGDQVVRASNYFRTLAVPRGSRVVDLFIAPEYLFARSDQAHFVSEKSKDRIVKGLQSLTQRYPSFVLIPGTIAWKKPAVRGFFAQCYKSDRGQKALDRRAQPDMGISAGSSRKFRTARSSGRQYYLGQNTAYVLRNGEILAKHHKRQDGGETNDNDGDNVFFVPGEREGMFSIDGIDFALQVCAEHFGAELSRDVDIHVVIASSHPLINNRARVVEGGYAMHADAVHPPKVFRKEQGNLAEVNPGQANTASPLTDEQIQGRVARLQQIRPNTQAAQVATEMGGRLNFYDLAFTK